MKKHQDALKESQAFEDVSHVYHCAALISFAPKDFTQLNKTNTEGTANIVNLCIIHSIQKLCYVSSVETMGVDPVSVFS